MTWKDLEFCFGVHVAPPDGVVLRGVDGHDGAVALLALEGGEVGAELGGVAAAAAPA